MQLNYGNELQPTVIECPGCLSDLRVPPLSELGRLGTVLKEADFVEGFELRCRFCGTIFPVPSEAEIQQSRDELQEAIDQLKKEQGFT